MHLDSKDDNATSAGDEIGHYQVVILDKKTLYHKGWATNSHRDETRQRDAVSVASTNSLNSLRQIAEYQTKGGNPTTNINNKLMFHSTIVVLLNMTCIDCKGREKKRRITIIDGFFLSYCLKSRRKTLSLQSVTKTNNYEKSI